MENTDYQAPHGLYEITTGRQRKSGTRQFFDTKTGAHYISYQNGYVRREIRMQAISRATGKKYTHRLQYQLNPTRVTRYGYSPTQMFGSLDEATDVSYYNHVERKMISSEEDRIKLIKERASKYKGYKGSYHRQSDRFDVSFY